MARRLKDYMKTARTKPASPSRRQGRLVALPFRESEHLTVGITPSGPDAYRVAVLTHPAGKPARLKEAFVVGAGEEPPTPWPAGANVPIVLAMPRCEVLVRTIRVPSSDPRQIAQMIPYEAAGHLPWPWEESEVGYEVQGTDAEGYTTVLLFMAQRASVEGHLAKLAAYGIRPTRIEVSVLSAARLLAASSDGDRPAMLILDEDGQTYVRLSGGIHAFSRGVAGVQDPDAMLRQTIELDGRRNGQRGRFTSLILAGPRAVDVDALAHVADPSVSVTPAGDAEFACVNGGALSGADVIPVGAALGASGQVSASLLPEREVHSLVLKRAFRQAKTLALLVAWLAAVLSGIIYYSFYKERVRGERAQEAIAALEEEVGDLRAQSEALTLLAGERVLVRLPLSVVLELYERTPAAVAVNSMQLSARGALVLRGESSSFPLVLQYIDNLSQSPLLRKVELVYITRPEGGAGGELAEFKVTAQLKTERAK
ncbi:MAG: PilN domain-containing protein [Candidatus Hydrogenedentes bacterium]|nr:PilN domain-containing protein [Candidatus Hydrogenedentota bacterium]